MIQELLYIRPHKVISLSVISLFLGTTFLESTHAAFVFKKPLRAGRRHRWGPGRRGRLARVREHPIGRGRSPSVLLATHPTTGEPARLQERRDALDQPSLAHVRAPPSGRGRSPKLAVSYPRQCRVAAAYRLLAHSVRIPGFRGPQITGAAAERTLRIHRAAAGRSRRKLGARPRRGLALAGTRRAAIVAARDHPRPPEKKSNRADEAEVRYQDLLSGHGVHRVQAVAVTQ